VLPFNGGAPASALPFILLTSEDGTPLVYTETGGAGHMNDSAPVVEDAQATYDRLRAAALPPEASLSLIRTIAEEFAK
jgi:hypothetical protein